MIQTFLIIYIMYHSFMISVFNGKTLKPPIYSNIGLFYTWLIRQLNKMVIPQAKIFEKQKLKTILQLAIKSGVMYVCICFVAMLNIFFCCSVVFFYHVHYAFFCNLFCHRTRTSLNMSFLCVLLCICFFIQHWLEV